MSIATDKSIPTWGEVKNHVNDMFRNEHMYTIYSTPLDLSYTGNQFYGGSGANPFDVRYGNGHKSFDPIFIELVIAETANFNIIQDKPGFIGNMYFIASCMLPTCYQLYHEGNMIINKISDSITKSFEASDKSEYLCNLQNIHFSFKDPYLSNFVINMTDDDMVGESEPGLFSAFLITY